MFALEEIQTLWKTRFLKQAQNFVSQTFSWEIEKILNDNETIKFKFQFSTDSGKGDEKEREKLGIKLLKLLWNLFFSQVDKKQKWKHMGFCTPSFSLILLTWFFFPQWLQYVRKICNIVREKFRRWRKKISFIRGL